MHRDSATKSSATLTGILPPSKGVSNAPHTRTTKLLTEAINSSFSHIAEEYREVAKRLGCHFLDAGSIPGIEMYPYDWMHLSLESHRIFAEYLAVYLPSEIFR